MLVFGNVGMGWARRRDGAREAGASQKRGGEMGRNLVGAVSGAGGREGPGT